MRALASLIMSHPMTAALIAAVCGLLALMLPPLLVPSGATIALVTLRRGPRQGGWVLGLAVAAGGVLAWAMLGAPQLVLTLALLLWIPLLALATLLRSSISLRLTLQVTGLLSLVAVLAFYLVLGDPATWWNGVIHTMLSRLQHAGVFTDSGTRKQLAHFFDSWAPLAPGQLVFSGLLIVLLALLVGRWWQALLYNPGGFGDEFRGLRLGRPLATLMALLLVLAMVPGRPLLINLCLALSVVFLLQGLALAHGVITQLGLGKGWLVAFYGALFVLELWPFLLILAVIDDWIDFRSRLRTARRPR